MLIQEDAVALEPQDEKTFDNYSTNIRLVIASVPRRFNALLQAMRLCTKTISNNAVSEATPGSSISQS